MGKRLRYADLSRAASECTLFNIRRASRAITQIYDAAFAPLGLKGNQFTLLTAIALIGEPTMTQLGKSLGTDRTTLTRNLAPLERAGLIRTTIGSDRRSRIVKMTPRGLDRLGRAVPPVEADSGTGHSGDGQVALAGPSGSPLGGHRARPGVKPLGFECIYTQ